MFTILTTLYNSEKYIERTIRSIQLQTFKDYKVYITDDLSTDSSYETAKASIEGDERFVLIKNPIKLYQPGNYFQLLKRYEVSDDSIIVTLDGDDWFSDDKVLERLVSYYKDPIWMCLGQFVQCHSIANKVYERGFTAKPNSFKDLRSVPWTCSHLRTFKAFLFRKILREDLISPTGSFWEVTGDLSFMYPMLEMSGESRVKFVEDINMVYNVETPLNDFKVNLEKQLHYAKLIRSKQPYKELP